MVTVNLLANYVANPSPNRRGKHSEETEEWNHHFKCLILGFNDV